MKRGGLVSQGRIESKGEEYSASLLQVEQQAQEEGGGGRIRSRVGRDK